MRLQARSWPVWLFVATSLLLNVFLPPLIEWIDFRNFDRQIQALIFFAGVLVGECCFVVLVAGLTKRTWLGAYLFGLGLAGAGYVAILIGVEEFDSDAISGMAMLPMFLLVAASPLYALRQHFGWRLVAHGASSPPRQPLRLGDIFSLIAIVASAQVLARVPQVIMEEDPSDYWFPIVLTCLILSGTSLIVLPIHARVALRDGRIMGKLAWLTLLAIMMVVICFGILQCFYDLNSDWDERLEILPYLFTFLGAAVGTFYLSLLLLRANGTRLEYARSWTRGEQIESTLKEAVHLQRLTWWRVGSVVAVTMTTSVYLANLERWRAIRDKENDELHAIVEATGGEMDVLDRIPRAITLGSRATDDDFAAIVICNELQSLCLQGCEITDDGMRQLEHFASLQLLTIENMRVTDRGLADLGHLPNLELLEITGCDVKASSVGSLPRKELLLTLDLSETQLGDVECEMLTEFPALTTLTLNHTRVTDRSLTTVGQLATLGQLNLVGVDMSAEQFPHLPVLHHLDLSHTKVNDTAIGSIAQLANLQFLTIRDTKITNTALTALSRSRELHYVDVSDNVIDDEGLRELGGSPSLHSIDLSCTEVTGSGFATWQPKPHTRNIILDRTRLNDDGVAALISIGEVADLSLADTTITDACLGHLAQISIGELDIRGTQVTFNGLVANGLPSVSKLRVATGQFTAPQISQLRQLNIKVTIEHP